MIICGFQLLETTSSISELYTLPHIVKVTDSFSCTQIDTIDLVELTDPIQTQSSIVDIVSCYNGSDGVLTTNPIGGMPDYSYIWLDTNLDTVSVTQNAKDFLLVLIWFMFQIVLIVDLVLILL